ncbi:xylem serine proteinase 1 [Phtheirospermum japonicum]|uniref:Xylem serine proteinase 1 n=1 Tax=Phtheirospermum japonicum TaxID=374723 RepID=A0A830C6G8_9LAMI|nr:xylem serine proteinase 1 [Phtheirospermum japonicum]
MSFAAVVSFILFLGVHVYISALWHLASVVFVLEPLYGFAAMRKSYELLSGKTRTGTFIVFVYMAACGMINVFFGLWCTDGAIWGYDEDCGRWGSGGDNHVPFIGRAGTIMSDNDYLSNSYPTSSPLAVIFKTASVNVTYPIIARFSARLPQELTPNILKRDIAAPGVYILAAFTKFTTMTGSDSDKEW